MLTMFGLAPILYGVAMLVSGTFRRWFSWMGIIVGSTVVGGALLSMVDINRKVLDARVWAVTSSLVVIWFFAIGIRLWRQAGAVAAETDRAPALVGSTF
jgi:hypothetical protein